MAPAASSAADRCSTRPARAASSGAAARVHSSMNAANAAPVVPCSRFAPRRPAPAMARRSPVGGRRPRASPMSPARGEHGVDDQVPEHDRQQREGEDVDVLAVADLLEEGAEREGGQRQQHADPGAPRGRAGGLCERAVALPQLADEQLGALLDEPLGRRFLAALAGAPAREFRGRAGGVLPVGLGDQRAVAVRAFDGADQHDIAGGVFVHGCIIAALRAVREAPGVGPGPVPDGIRYPRFCALATPKGGPGAARSRLLGRPLRPCRPA